MTVAQGIDMGNKYRTPAGESWAARQEVCPGDFAFDDGQRVIFVKDRGRKAPLLIYGTVTERRITHAPAGEGWCKSNGYVVTDAAGTRWLADETSLRPDAGSGTVRDLDCPHCGRQQHDWNGYQRWPSRMNRQPTPQWTCRNCGSTHSGPDPEQTNLDETQADFLAGTGRR